MCECGGEGTVERFVTGLGITEVQCPDDECIYWNGDQG